MESLLGQQRSTSDFHELVPKAPGKQSSGIGGRQEAVLEWASRAIALLALNPKLASWYPSEHRSQMNKTSDMKIGPHVLKGAE